MMFTEQEIRESRCDGTPRGYIWVHSAKKAVWADGEVTECYVREDDSERLTPDEAVRLLRERGVIEDEPAQPDKWAHLPKGGEWVHCPSAACIYHVTDLTHEAFDMDGLSGGVARIDRFVLAASDTTMTRAEAIAIFEANAAPDHIPDAGKMVGADLATANARIAVLEQQLADATTSALNADECLNQSYAAHARTGDELHDARRDIIALRERAAAMAKGIGERDSLLGELRQQLADIQSSEVVTDAERASARAAVDLMEQVEERDATIADLRKQLSKDEAGYDDLMRHFEEHERTIADLRKQATAGAEKNLTYDQVYARAAVMCLAAKYAPGMIRGCADEIVNDAYILVAALNAEEAKQ